MVVMGVPPASDDTRPHLAGALFEGDGKVVRMVTTDGHRLSKAEHRVDSGMLSFSMLVPNKGIGELRRLLDDIRAEQKGKGEGGARVAVATSGGNAFFRGHDVLLSVKLADEQFPPYAKVIPQQQSRRVICARQSLVDSLRRISLVSSDKSGGVRLMVTPGTLRFGMRDDSVGLDTHRNFIYFVSQPMAGLTGGLLDFNSKMEPVAAVATEWDASADLKTWEDVSDRMRFPFEGAPERMRHGTVIPVPLALIETLRTTRVSVAPPVRP